MPSGYIGRSQLAYVNGRANPTTTGPVLSYTCPSVGVRYAVLSIIGSATCENNTNSCMRSGRVQASSSSGSNGSAISNGNEAYNVILGPGQSWSDNTEIIVGFGNAFLEASVLEVV